MWKLDGSELLSSSSTDEGSVVLGVLEDSVFSLSGSGLVRISRPVGGTQTVEAQLENSATRLTLVNSVMLPKREKVFVVSKEGFLHQVCVRTPPTGPDLQKLKNIYSSTALKYDL